MKGISDLRIARIDERRPPRIRKEPYIELYFRLSHRAPPEWCQNFNNLLGRHYYAPKIKTDEGLYIETGVRKPEEVEGLLELLETAVTRCSAQYVQSIEAKEPAAAVRTAGAGGEPSELARLNQIIAGHRSD